MGIDPVTVAALPRVSAADTVHVHVPCSVTGGPAGLAVDSVASPVHVGGRDVKVSPRESPVGLTMDPVGAPVGLSSVTVSWIENPYNVPAPTLTA